MSARESGGRGADKRWSAPNGAAPKSPPAALATTGHRPCVVIPVFDNAATVAGVALEAAEHADLVIVVDDGSRDGSGERVRAAAGRARLGATIDVVTLRRNRGKGAALVVGMTRARTLGRTHVVTLDADGQHRASDIPALLAESRAHPRAVVLGARDPAAPHVPPAALFGRRAANFWTLRTTGRALPDTICGLRVYPVAATLALPTASRRYDYEGEVLVRAAWAGLDLRSVPIDVFYPADRADRVTHYRPWIDSTWVSWMFLRLLASRIFAHRSPSVRPHVSPAVVGSRTR
jgi:glycosyltransferase involved in cell wall biosynthesis